MTTKTHIVLLRYEQSYCGICYSFPGVIINNIHVSNINDLINYVSKKTDKCVLGNDNRSLTCTRGKTPMSGKMVYKDKNTLIAIPHEFHFIDMVHTILDTIINVEKKPFGGGSCMGTVKRTIPYTGFIRTIAKTSDSLSTRYYERNSQMKLVGKKTKAVISDLQDDNGHYIGGTYNEITDYSTDETTHRVVIYYKGARVYAYVVDQEVGLYRVSFKSSGGNAFSKKLGEDRVKPFEEADIPRLHKAVDVAIRCLDKRICNDDEESSEEDEVDLSDAIREYLESAGYPSDEKHVDVVRAICDWSGYEDVEECLLAFHHKTQWEGVSYFFDSYTSAFDDWDKKERRLGLEIACYAKTGDKPLHVIAGNKPGYCQKCWKHVTIDEELQKAMKRYGSEYAGLIHTIKKELTENIKSGDYVCYSCA